MSIQEIILKIKREGTPYAKDILFIGIVLLIGFSCFLLGKIASKHTVLGTNENIEILYPPQPIVTKELYPAKKDNHVLSSKTGLNVSISSSWKYAGSKSGKTYYTYTCKGINRVKPENRVYFTTREQAEQAGYHLSTTCKE